MGVSRGKVKREVSRKNEIIENYGYQPHPFVSGDDLAYFFEIDKVIRLDFGFDEKDNLNRIYLFETEHEDKSFKNRKVLFYNESKNIGISDVSAVLDLLVERLMPKINFNVFGINECPICESKIEVDEEILEARLSVQHITKADCSNRCYSVHIYKRFEKPESDGRLTHLSYYVEIFDRTSVDFMNNENELTLKNRVKHKVAYWKRNNRYLAKILEESD